MRLGDCGFDRVMAGSDAADIQSDVPLEDLLIKSVRRKK
jgi:hypothetical protein